MFSAKWLSSPKVKSAVKKGDIKINDFVGRLFQCSLFSTGNQETEDVMVWKGLGDPGVLVSLSIRFSRARNPCSLSIHRRSMHPYKRSSSYYSISKSEVRLGAFEMISHSMTKQKWSWAENKCLFLLLPEPSAEQIQISSQISRTSLLCSSLRFFTAGLQASPRTFLYTYRTFLYTYNRKRKVKCMNPKFKLGKGSSKSQPEFKTVLGFSLEIMLDQKELQPLFPF